jgi:hypothetical protein
MRRTIATIVVLGLIWLGYVIWPLYTVVQIASAVENRDLGFLVRHVDFAAVRLSFAEQVMDGYLSSLIGDSAKHNGHTQPDPRLTVLRSVAGSAASIADPFVAKYITPESLADLLHQGWPADAIARRPHGTVGLSRANVGTLWQIFANSDYGIGRFSVRVPAAIPAEHAFGFDFRLSLSRMRWQLRKVQLPGPVRDLIVEELKKSLTKQTQSR